MPDPTNPDDELMRTARAYMARLSSQPPPRDLAEDAVKAAFSRRRRFSLAGLIGGSAVIVAGAAAAAVVLAFHTPPVAGLPAHTPPAVSTASPSATPSGTPMPTTPAPVRQRLPGQPGPGHRLAAGHQPASRAGRGDKPADCPRQDQRLRGHVSDRRQGCVGNEPGQQGRPLPTGPDAVVLQRKRRLRGQGADARLCMGLSAQRQGRQPSGDRTSTDHVDALMNGLGDTPTEVSRTVEVHP